MSDSVRVFVRRTELDHPAAEVFRWHERPGAFERLAPPWEGLELVEGGAGIAPGTRNVLRVRLGPLAVRWIAEHRAADVPLAFRDVQVAGPFARWEHLHVVEPRGARSVLVDEVRLRLPCGALGDRVAWPLVRARIERVFDHRARVLASDLARHRGAGLPPMKILVSGSSGLIGSALVPFLTSGGHEVVRLVRGTPQGAGTLAWDPTRGPEPSALEGFDAVVHLAGENIAAGRWSAERMQRIRDSRVQGTRALCEALARVRRRPQVLVSASAIGYYGDRGTELLTEQSAAGAGFLAEVCRAWEGATAPASDAGIRVACLRTGVVLSPRGGALARMLLPFRLGLGGRIGSGHQMMSWIALDDLVGAFHHALATSGLAGPVNAVAPEAVSNREFTRVLAHVLHRPAFAPLPAPAARVLLGKMADELLLASQRVVPERLEETGFRFAYPGLEGALRHVLGRA